MPIANKIGTTHNVQIVLIWIAYLFTCVQYFLSWHFEGSDAFLRYATAFCIILSIDFGKWDKFKMFLFVLLPIALILRRLLIVWTLLSIVYQIDQLKIPIRKLSILAISVLAIEIFLQVESILLDIIENEGKRFIKSDVIIYDLGTGNPNRASSLFFKVSLFSYILFKDKQRYLFVITTILASILGFVVTGSRTTLACSVLLLILAFGYWRKWFKNWMRFAIASLPVIMFIVTFYLAINLEENKNLNEIASGRLWYIVKFTSEFTTKEWLIGAPRSIDEPLDSAYLEIIHTGGILLATFFCLSFILSVLKYYTQFLPYIPILIVVLVGGLTESIILRPSDISIIFWMLTLYVFIKPKPIISS